MRGGPGPDPTLRGGFLGSSSPAAWARAIDTESMYIVRKQAIHVPFTVSTLAKTAEEEALLDSGATHNFLDKRMVRRLGLGTKTLAKPRPIKNVDGTGNQGGALTKYTDLKVIRGQIAEIQ